MTKQIIKRWQALLLATIATFIVLSASSSAFAQKSWNDKSPKPDFSAMEEYYEIVEYEYDFTGSSMGTFTAIAKKKQAKTPIWWVVVWRDAKGVKLAQHTLMFTRSDGQEAEIGEPIKGWSYGPKGEKRFFLQKQNHENLNNLRRQGLFSFQVFVFSADDVA
jgi:hypothetical protein